MDLPKRKINRLQHYDYSQNGAYYITICTKDRKNLLCADVGGGIPDAPKRMALTAVGKLCDDTINYLNSHNENITIDKYVIMPNHIHLLIFIDNKMRGVRDAAPYNEILPKLVSSFKRYTNKKCGFPIWQRSFHDHIIRSERDYEEIWEYIDQNPLKWELDSLYEK